MATTWKKKEQQRDAKYNAEMQTKWRKATCKTCKETYWTRPEQVLLVTDDNVYDYELGRTLIEASLDQFQV